jgi:hypothetical protein
MNQGRNVTIDAALYEAMAVCYYGGGPDYWARTGQSRPTGIETQTSLDQEAEPTIVFNDDTHQVFEKMYDSDVFNRFTGPGTRVIPMDLAAEPTSSTGPEVEDTDAD